MYSFLLGPHQGGGCVVAAVAESNGDGDLFGFKNRGRICRGSSPVQTIPRQPLPLCILPLKDGHVCFTTFTIDQYLLLTGNACVTFCLCYMAASLIEIADVCAVEGHAPVESCQQLGHGLFRGGARRDTGIGHL